MPPEFFSVDMKNSKRSVLIVVLLATLFLLSFEMLYAAEPGTGDYEWYNTTWRHRVGLEIEMNEETKDWPVEYEINFTELLEQENASGTFDENSIRVMEYSEKGEILTEVPSQFSEGDEFEKETNAYGEIIFLLNGTNPEESTRNFYIYYDIEENGLKEAPQYEENISYDYDEGEGEINVTTEEFEYLLDTERGDHTSGIHRIEEDERDENIIYSEEDERTAEYIEYSNGTDMFTFKPDEINFEEGPRRLTITQKGNPTFYDGTQEDSLHLEKRYHFYWGPEYYDDDDLESLGFYKIEQEITNVGDEEYTLKSTPLGAVRWDLNRTLHDPEDQISYTDDYSNYTDPYSWIAGRSSDSYRYQGLINLPGSNENYNANANVTEENNIETIGTNLSEVNLETGETLEHSTFQGSGMAVGFGHFMDIKNVFMNSPTIEEHEPESYYAELDTWTSKQIYNRDEDIEVIANITEDPYNLNESMVAALDKNTTESDENVTLDLEKNKTGYWTGTYSSHEDSNIGTWDFNATVYTEDDEELGSNASSFTVTDELFTNLTLEEDVIPEGEPVKGNLTVKNYRQDENISGAEVDCYYNSETVENISEVEPGLYSLNFTAPDIGEYELVCNASKTGNTGEDEENFETEVAEVDLDTTTEPPEETIEDITYEEGSDFDFSVNITNPDEGVAYSTNISLNISENLTLDSEFDDDCGDIEAGEYCLRPFTAEIPNATEPGNYIVNVTTEWTNPIGTEGSDEEQLPIEVLENPQVRIDEDEISQTLAGGFTTYIDNFTAESFGNYNLTNVSFECQEGDLCEEFNFSYNPENITNLEPDENETVEVTAVEVPKDIDPGTYEGTINASTNETYDTLDVTIEVIGETEVETETVPPERITADSVTLHDSQTVDFEINSTNIGDAFAFNITQNTDSEEGWDTSGEESHDNLNVSESLVNEFTTTVPENTTPGNYSLTSYTDWDDPDGTSKSSYSDIEVEVKKNPVQNVPEDYFEEEISPDETEEIGSFEVESIGNYNLTNVSFECQEGEACDELEANFTPENISNIGVNDSEAVSINVSVPEGHPAGEYTGDINVSSSGGYDLIEINITVLSTASWNLIPDECRGASDPDVGTLCSPVIENTGNIELDMSIEPEEANKTEVNMTDFEVGIDESKSFDLDYNVTEDPGSTHRALYNVSTEEESEPYTTRQLNVTVYPSNPPTLEAWANPQEILQGEETEIVANVTPETEFNITEVNVTVTDPGDDSTTSIAELVERKNNYSLWNISYPEDFEDAATDLRGLYNVSVTASDEIDNMNTTYTNFTATAVIYDELMTLREEKNRCYFTAEEDAETIVEYLNDESVHPELEQKFEDEDGCYLFDYTSVNTLEENESWEVRVLDVQDNEDYRYDVSYEEGEITVKEDITVYYNPGEEGSIYYSLTDEVGDGIDGADVNFSVVDPEGYELMSEQGVTDYEGSISPHDLTFELTDDVWPGVYDITADASWEDPDVDRDVEIDSHGRFAVTGNFDINWNLGGVWFNGTNRTVWTLIERNDEPRDIDDMNLTLYHPNGTVFSRSNLEDFERQQKGIYKTDKWIPNETEFGTYWGELEVREGESKGAKYDSFRVRQEGDLIFVNFDVNMSLHDHEVPQGEYLYFDLSITRMEGEDVDAEVSYWVEDDDGDEYYYASEMLLTPVNQTIDLSRNVYIYQDQPTENYTAYVEVDPLDGTESFTASETFKVVEGEEEEDPDIIWEEEVEQVTRPVDEEPEEEVIEMSIIDAPQFINLVRGEEAYKSIMVANFGDKPLQNTSLSIMGIPPDWFEISPDEVEIPVHETETFSARIQVPEDGTLDNDEATFLVTSKEEEVSKAVDIQIAESLEEKIQMDIENVTQMLKQVRKEGYEAEEKGIDVSSVMELLDEAESKVEEAEQQLEDGETDEALQSINEAEGLIREASRILETLEEPEREIWRFLPAVLIGLGILGLILVVSYLIKVRHYRPGSGIKDKISGVMTEMKKKKIKEKEELKEEKEKAKRLIRLIEAEHEEGIMDDETYENLKQSANEKIERINRKLDE